MRKPEALVKNLEKIVFIFLVQWAFLIVLGLIGLLKVAGRFKEIDLEPFPKPKERRKMVVAMNHPDGNEWVFAYRRFFRPLYLIAPWLILEELPYALARKTNFQNPILTSFELALIFVDPGKSQEALRRSSLIKTIRALESDVPIIGFFEGHRTRNCSSFFYSKRGKALGKLNESLGLIAKKISAPIKPAWIEFRGCSFYSLPENGKFSLKRLLLWYWLTLIGKNGTIILLWGETMRFDKENRRQITRSVQNYLLSLADRI